MFLASVEYNEDDGYDDQQQSTSYTSKNDVSAKETLWKMMNNT